MPLLHFHTPGRSLLEHLTVSSSLQGIFYFFSYANSSGSQVSALHTETEQDHSSTLSLSCVIMNPVTTALQTAAALWQLLMRSKQGRSVCIRGEDAAESVAIKDGTARLNFNTTRRRSLIGVKEQRRGGRTV